LFEITKRNCGTVEYMYNFFLF